MQLSKEAIEEFKKIYKKEFKKELSDQEAHRRANNLLSLYRAIYGDRLKSERKEQ